MNFLRALACLLCSLAPCLADGGAILSRQTVDGLDITVFASPAPLRAGPTDVSVLVIDPKTSQPVLDASVDITWAPPAEAASEWLPPCCQMMVSPTGISAMRAHSQNKFLYSAMVPIKSSGDSEITVRVKRNGQTVRLPTRVSVGPPAPPWQAYWTWLAFPFVGIAVFGLHQRLSRRRYFDAAAVKNG